ncbi:hypothetical protein D3C73_209820 [compost metagenome]|jgi:hypothetical protein
MSFLDTLKELAGTAVEAIKENPVAAAAIGGGSLVVVGGGIYAKRRWSAHKAAKAAAPAVAPTATLADIITPVAAPEAAASADPKETLLNPEYQHPERPQGTAKA